MLLQQKMDRSNSDISTDIVPNLSRLSTVDSLFNDSSCSGTLSPIMSSGSTFFGSAVDVDAPSVTGVTTAITDPSRWHAISIMLESEVDEFGGLCKSYGRLLTIRLYMNKTTPMAQIGSFTEVPINEAGACLFFQKEYNRAVNMMLKLEGCSIKENVLQFAGALRQLLPLFHGQTARSEIERCVFDMDDWTHVCLLTHPICSNLDRLFELNIGQAREMDAAVPPFNMEFEDEADQILVLLKSWLQTTGRSIRCLRVYSFVRVNPGLEALLDNCPKLSHLTLSKLAKVIETCEFHSITSFEFDGQELAYSDEDLKLAKRACIIFPNATVFAFVRTVMGPVVESFLASRTTVQRSDNFSFELYQPTDDIRAVAATIRNIYKEVSRHPPANESQRPDYLDLINEKYSTRLRIHRVGQIYKTPVCE